MLTKPKKQHPNTQDNKSTSELNQNINHNKKKDAILYGLRMEGEIWNSCVKGVLGCNLSKITRPFFHWSHFQIAQFDHCCREIGLDVEGFSMHWRRCLLWETMLLLPSSCSLWLIDVIRSLALLLYERKEDYKVSGSGSTLLQVQPTEEVWVSVALETIVRSFILIWIPTFLVLKGTTTLDRKLGATSLSIYNHYKSTSHMPLLLNQTHQKIRRKKHSRSKHIRK